VTEGKNKEAILTEISLILAAIFWGTNYAATKFAALSIPPLSIVALRFVVGGLLMYAVLRVLEPGSSPGRKALLRMAGLGFITCKEMRSAVRVRSSALFIRLR
jgi:drug/metabolite transporter (DMT)-like permease